MIVPPRENAPGTGVVFTGADALPFSLMSESSLEDSSELESSDESTIFLGVGFARAAAFARISFDDAGTVDFPLIGSAFFEVPFLLLLSVFAMVDSYLEYDFAPLSVLKILANCYT